MLRFITCTLILAWAICLLGCMGVAWLHDSSGFVFVRGNTLVLYDVDEREESEILSADWLNYMIHPAVSPNDKRVALLKIEEGEEALDYQVFIYKLNGELVKESPVLTVAVEPDDEDNNSIDLSGVLNYVEWSPTGKKILFLVALPEEGCSGVYDYKSNTISLIRDAYPPFYMNGPSCSPDGKGYVALTPVEGDDDESESLVYVEWDGTIHEIDDSDPEMTELGLGDTSEYGLYQTMRWKDDVLIFTLEDGGQVQVDVIAMKAEPTEGNAGLFEHAQKYGVTHVLPFGEGLVLQLAGSEIQVADPNDESATKTIFDGLNPDKDIWYFVSPDGQRVVIAIETEGGNKLLVVESDGELVAELSRE